MLGEVVGGTEDRERLVAEELVDVPSAVDDDDVDNALRRAAVSSAVLVSANGVKSRTSTNITVTVRRSPVNTSSPCSRSLAARRGSTYVPNAACSRWRSAKPACMHACD